MAFTVQQIRTALTAVLDAHAALHGETTELSELDNVALTDELAGVCETVNPNHDYPPTNK